MRNAIALVGVLSVVTIGCGKSAEQKQAEEAARAAAQAAQSGAAQAGSGAATAAKGLEQMAKGLEQLASGAADMKPVDPVSFRDLQALFPTLDGWERAKPTGERMTSPVSYSQASVEYTKGESTIEIKIVDSGFNQILVAPLMMFMTAGYEKETSDGYEKSVKVAGQPGWEKWNSESKDGEVNAVVGKRFVVTIEGRHIEDTKVLHQVAERTDLGKLAAMK